MPHIEIKYTGMTTLPSDYDSPDGDLAVMCNLINENGIIKPLSLPDPFFSCMQGEKLNYIHSHSKYENFIFITESNNVLFSPKDKLQEERITITNFDKIIEIKKIVSLGNMLLVLTNEGIFYYLYRDNSYLELGNKLPELPSFHINETPVRLGLYGSFGDSIDSTTIYEKRQAIWSGSNDNYDKNRESETYIINKFLSILSLTGYRYYEKNAFIYPFFLRLAYRMYDGSTVCHSAPIMLLSDNHNIELIANDYFGIAAGGTINDLQINGIEPRKYEIIIEPEFDISAWEDLITSIDIFISQPIYPINTAAAEFYNIISITDESKPIGGYIQFDLKDDISKDKFIEKLKSNSLFYKIHSIKTKDIDKRNEYEYTVSAEHLMKNTLVNQETLTDDYRSRSIIMANNIFIYNNRVNVSNINISYFTGFNPKMFDLELYSYILTYPDGSIGNESRKLGNLIKTSDSGTTEITIFIKDNTDAVSTVKDIFPGTYKLPRYFFYPESQAYKAIYTSGGKSIEITLEPHSSLNGAQYLNETFGDETVTGQLIVTENSDKYSFSPNEIKTSEVNNPLVFRPANSYFVGNGEILALSSATKALSQGQFGQFPLYAFTTEGIWALEISETGTYSAKQPATRDVCNNTKSILQLDGAIAFTTEQGIMLLTGSESNCISDIINDNPLDISSLQKLDKINLNNLTVKIIQLKEYLKGSFMAYDYPHSRLLVINPEQDYLYIYSLKSKTWSILSDSFVDALNAYPDSYLQKENGEIVNLSNETKNISVNGLIITRPIKCQAPDTLKTITQLIHRGVFQRGKIGSILYASRDYITYSPVASSHDHFIRSYHGSPYKSFVIVLIPKGLTEKENISGTSIIFEPKFNNKLR